LATVDLQDSTIQEIGNEKKEYEIRVSLKKGNSTVVYKKVKQALDQHFKGQYKILEVNYISGVVGEELKRASIYSIIAVMVAILIYVGYRFEPVFALGAV